MPGPNIDTHVPESKGARLILALGLGTVIAFAWGYVVAVSSSEMDTSSALAMPMTAEWSLSQSLLMVVMWAAMMTAMMLPSAAPMVSAYSRAVRTSTDGRAGPVSVFVAGYLAVWGVFAIAATGLQWLLHDIAVVNGMGTLQDPRLAGAALVVAGAYELTPIKATMLGSCRTPVGFLATHWRDGTAGALRMGVDHGRSCLACCWALMLLLFVYGVMNLLWVLILAAVVALEKLTHSVVVPRVFGAGLIASGIVVFLLSATR